MRCVAQHFSLVYLRYFAKKIDIILLMLQIGKWGTSMLSILPKVSKPGDKPGSINPGTVLYLVGSAAFPYTRASFQFATSFIMKLWVCDGTSLEKSCSFQYAHLVSGIGQEWNEHVFKSCAILHIHKGPYQGCIGNLIANAPMFFSLQFYSFMDYV